jgi:hypothetical protein
MNTKQLTPDLIDLINKLYDISINRLRLTNTEKELLEKNKIYFTRIHKTRNNFELSELGWKLINLYVNDVLSCLMDKSIIKRLINMSFECKFEIKKDDENIKLIQWRLIYPKYKIGRDTLTFLGNCVKKQYMKNYFEAIGENDFDVWEEVYKFVKALANKTQCEMISSDNASISFINSDGIIIKHFSFD